MNKHSEIRIAFVAEGLCVVSGDLHLLEPKLEFGSDVVCLTRLMTVMTYGLDGLESLEIGLRATFWSFRQSDTKKPKAWTTQYFLSDSIRCYDDQSLYRKTSDV